MTFEDICKGFHSDVLYMHFVKTKCCLMFIAQYF